MAKKRLQRAGNNKEKEKREIKEELLSEKRTELAQIRTELAYERTTMSDFRTSLTAILFGIAFLGFAKERWDFLYTSGVLAIILGIIFLLSAFQRGRKHAQELKNVQEILSRIPFIGRLTRLKEKNSSWEK